MNLRCSVTRMIFFVFRSRRDYHSFRPRGGDSKEGSGVLQGEELQVEDRTWRGEIPLHQPLQRR